MRFPSPLLPLSLSLGLSLAACAPSAPFREAENLSAQPFNQLDLAGNACGPAALLNSYRFGKKTWRTLSEQPPDLSDRARIRAIARGPSMRESASLPGRARWSRGGINISDLTDVANEISAGKNLPKLSHTTLVIHPPQTPEKHLRSIHAKLASSLSKGIPPLLSVRLYAERNGKWTSIQGHFVTVTSVPTRLEKGSHHFPIKIIDPLGGKFRQGHLKISSQQGIDFFTEAEIPGISIGRKSLKPGEKSFLAVSAALGHF